MIALHVSLIFQVIKIMCTLYKRPEIHPVESKRNLEVQSSLDLDQF